MFDPDSLRRLVDDGPIRPQSHDVAATPWQIGISMIDASPNLGQHDLVDYYLVPEIRATNGALVRAAHWEQGPRAWAIARGYEWKIAPRGYRRSSGGELSRLLPALRL